MIFTILYAILIICLITGCISAIGGLICVYLLYWKD